MCSIRFAATVCICTLSMLPSLTHAAPRTAPFPGLRESAPSSHAIVGAKIVVSPERTIEKGNLILRDGLIVAVGENAAVPGDAQVWKADGKTLYPGLIDAYNELPADAARGVDRGGAGYWNGHITPQVRAHQLYTSDASTNRRLRGQGITVRLVAPAAGIIKGVSALVTTADDSGKQVILKDQVALHLKLTVARGIGGYPNSPMGALTLVRQALYDAGWYGEAWSAFSQNHDVPRPERSDALEVLRGYLGGKLPVIVDAADELYFLRADRVGKEFGLDVIVHGSGEEYRRLDDIKATGRAVIVPLNFPKAPNVSTPEAEMNASLERLMHWELAPENPARLAEAGVRIALTSHALRDTGTFLASVRKAVKRGLKPEAALRAMTVTPAELFGVADRLGTLEQGKAANLVVASGDLFAPKTKLLETWIDGQRYEVEPEPPVDVRGKWNLDFAKPEGGNERLVIEITGQPNKLSGKVVRGEQNTPLIGAAMSDAQFSASFKGKPVGFDGLLQFSGTVSPADPKAEKPADTPAPSWLGTVVWHDGQRLAAKAERVGDVKEPAEKKPDAEAKKDDAKPAGDEEKKSGRRQKARSRKGQETRHERPRR